MDDYGARYTDAKVREVRKRLDEVYRKAAKEIELKTQDFWRRHRIKDQIYRAQVAHGQLDKEDYQAWMRGQVFQGEQWKAKREQIARTMTDADKIAMKIVNGEKANIFATNANYLGYSLEKELKANIGFGLYDSATVARLIKDEPDLLPALNPEKIVEGEDMRWYQKTVTQSVTQGIIQGESIQQIFERIALTCTDRAENAAMRDARTAYTGAQNAGRVEAMRQSKSLGIDVKKLWIATLDFKTRDTHRELDGQIVGVDSSFHSSEGSIAYPGDPTAEPALIYNCRCTLGWYYPKYNNIPDRIDNTTDKNIGKMTYKQWYDWKGGAAAEKAAKNKE